MTISCAGPGGCELVGSSDNRPPGGWKLTQRHIGETLEKLMDGHHRRAPSANTSPSDNGQSNAGQSRANDPSGMARQARHADATCSNATQGIALECSHRGRRELITRRPCCVRPPEKNPAISAALFDVARVTDSAAESGDSLARSISPSCSSGMMPA